MSRPVCPKCGGHEFTVSAMASTRVYYPQEGEETYNYDKTSFSIDNTADGTCTSCDYQAPLGEMRAPPKCSWFGFAQGTILALGIFDNETDAMNSPAGTGCSWVADEAAAVDWLQDLQDLIPADVKERYGV